MTWQAWVIGVLAVAVVLLAGYAVSLRRRSPTPGVPAAPAASAPTSPHASAVPPVQAAVLPPADDGFVITRVGETEADSWRVSDRVVLSATLGEPLVKALALAHGLRRALSPANRNRIGFEVRQEVRRSRKVRRQEMRTAWRDMKAQERTRTAGSDDGVEGAA